jgi:osmotically inducible protein OsmC
VAFNLAQQPNFLTKILSTNSTHRPSPLSVNYIYSLESSFCDMHAPRPDAHKGAIFHPSPSTSSKNGAPWNAIVGGIESASEATTMGNPSKILYTATATAKGGREGHVHSSDGVLDLDMRMPKELGGPGGNGSNPEQLFAAGYAACFESAVRHVARDKKILLKDVSVTAHVGIGPRQPTGFGIAVKLEVSLPGIDHAAAQELIDIAHRDMCPYSHATRGNVDVQISLV